MPYIGTSREDQKTMLTTIGIASVSELFIDIPETLILKRDLNLEAGYSEWQLVRYFKNLAEKNSKKTFLDFKGAGCYRHHVPTLVKALSSRGEFLTAYTPYQPEVSQGTLEAIYKFQSYMADLSGMEIANASMYDAATAFAEAITMSHRLNKDREIYLSKYIHPEYLSVAKNYLEPLGINYKFYDSISDLPDGSTMVIQNPNFYGEIISDDAINILKNTIKEHNLFLIVVCSEPFALFSQTKPGDWGASIVCGSAQSFGNSPYYGGAQVGFISSKLEYVRQMPGRIVGKTTDRKGQEGYVLTFQAREQHIKRERASSNICTNQSLHALCTAIYLTQMGRTGLREITRNIWAKTRVLINALSMLPNLEIKTQNPFNEFTLAFKPNAALDEFCSDHGVNINKILKNNSNLFSLDFSQSLHLFTVSEMHELEDLNALVQNLAQILSRSSSSFRVPEITQSDIEKFEKDFDNLELPELNIKDQGELAVCRYFTKLSQKNFSIDTNFYPLGSCTMKYNPKINDEIAANWSDLHPYDENVSGVLEVYQELNQALSEITGFHKFSLEPAAGAHGEYSALLMARRYFEDRKEKRDIVLVPDSAHGTNPASAAMAGFKTITIKSLANGDIDITDLEKTIAKHKNQIAVFMLTNPSTLGLFSQNILELVKLVHDDGGLLYYDGANLNAIAGVSRPGDMGFDLIHLNLHKTFSTPHGGGGPGAGPVGASETLAPYLPGPFLTNSAEQKLSWTYSNQSIGKVRAFHGNFNVLLRALIYIKRNGREGIKRIGENATLNANYLQARIRQSKILNADDILQIKFNRVCKHEFILSAYKLKEKYGITALDIAKRLLDKGIHAPTIYFPLTVAECIMIEPTETESKEELDLLITALEEIISEAQTESGREIIKTAPHTTQFSRFDDVKAVKEPVLSSCCSR